MHAVPELFHLPGLVSNHCLDILVRKHNEALGWGDEYEARCPHLLPVTHGLPYQCRLRNAFVKKEYIEMKELHPFWSTLNWVIDEDSLEDNDLRQLEAFVEQAKKKNKATIRRINAMFDSVLNQESWGYSQPEPKIDVKGRPKKGSSTRRDKSRHEYQDKGRPQQRTGKNQNTYASSSLNRPRNTKGMYYKAISL